MKYKRLFFHPKAHRYWGFCYVFCWPPVPSVVVDKIVLRPPPRSYRFYHKVPEDICAIEISHDEHSRLTEDLINRIQPFLFKSSSGKKIACVFLRRPTNPTYTIFYSHGNSVDLGMVCDYLYSLGKFLNCNIFCYDYSGYGLSTGNPSQKHLYSDAYGAWEALTGKFAVADENIIVLGHDIGSIPTAHIAAMKDVAGAAFHAPLASGMRYLGVNCFNKDFLDSGQDISEVTAPVLVVHSNNDPQINVKHGKAVYNSCRNPVEPLWLENSSHNEQDRQKIYWERLRNFIYFELTITPKLGEDETIIDESTSKAHHSPSLSNRVTFPKEESQLKREYSSDSFKLYYA